MPVATHTEENQTPEIAKGMRRSIGEDAVPAPGHSTANVPADYRQVNGWGVDLDPANRPAYPKELPSTVMTARGDVKHWQEPHTRVHVSNEHPNLTPAFGASRPPHGLSGRLRDYAYEFGEATNRHWMTLILADRVDMVETMIMDAFRGKGDNYVAEKAWPALFKYAPPKKKYLTLGVAALGVAALGLAVAAAMRKDD